MIEVEKQFLLSDDSTSRLLEGADFLREVVNNDVYYDTPDYFLTTHDNWLRKRNDKFELKVSLNDPGAREKGLPLQYDEIEEEDEIKRFLGFAESNDLTLSLQEGGYDVLGEWSIIRRQYTKQGFHVDIDSLSYGYEMVEIELLVRSKEEVAEAADRIIAFAKQHGFSIEPVRGKNAEYSYRNNRDHYDALVKAGVYAPI